MKRLVLGLVAAMVALAPSAAAADVIELVELAVNVDGTVHDSVGAPVVPLSFSGFDDSLFDYSTGLGVLTITVGGAGAHTVRAFYDHDLYDAGPNAVNTFFDDSGAALGSAPAGVRWEIDEPGFGVSYTGDIFSNFSGGTLDNTVFDGVLTEEDASMALSWDIILAQNEVAFVTFVTSISDPGGFRLRQFDAADNVYLSSSLRIVERAVPEPALFALVGLGAAASLRRLRRRS